MGTQLPSMDTLQGAWSQVKEVRGISREHQEKQESLAQ